jgi:hypothetical protein
VRLRGLRLLAQVAPGIALSDHLADRLDIGARGFGRKVRQAHLLGLGEFAFQSQHQREVAAHARVRLRARDRLPQRLLGLRQLLGQGEREAHVGENARLARRDLQRVAIELHRARVIAEPVRHHALHGHDVPPRIVRRIGARQHVLGLRELSGIGQRLAVFAEHVEILGRLYRRRLDDGDRLAVSRQRAQRPRVCDRGGFLPRIALVALAAILDVGAQLRLIGRQNRRSADRAGDVAEVLTAGERRRNGRQDGDEQCPQRESGAA